MREPKVKSFPKYTWVGNKISCQAMALMYRLKQKTGKPITQQVAEAVDMYLAGMVSDHGERDY